MIAPAPTVTPGRIITPAAIHTPSPITMGADLPGPARRVDGPNEWLAVTSTT